MAKHFRFHVKLLHITPTLWRRFLIKPNATFEDLHLAIQDACAWGNCHLYAFRTPDNRESIAGIPDDGGFGLPDPDARSMKVSP